MRKSLSILTLAFLILSLSTAAFAGEAASQAGGVVNINTADAAELETLPGIGPSLAQSIIDYRTEHGAFASIDAIMDVPGIGDGRCEAIKDLNTV